MNLKKIKTIFILKNSEHHRVYGSSLNIFLNNFHASKQPALFTTGMGPFVRSHRVTRFKAEKMVFSLHFFVVPDNEFSTYTMMLYAYLFLSSLCFARHLTRRNSIFMRGTRFFYFMTWLLMEPKLAEMNAKQFYKRSLLMRYFLRASSGVTNLRSGLVFMMI